VPRILSISRNPRLLALRNDALALAGYAVASPREPDEAVLLASHQPFDAVVVGHSVEHETREVLIRRLRALRPYMRILFVYTDPETVEEPLADVSVDVTTGSAPLVTALDNRLQRLSDIVARSVRLGRPDAEVLTIPCLHCLLQTSKAKLVKWFGSMSRRITSVQSCKSRNSGRNGEVQWSPSHCRTRERIGAGPFQ
jgi:hypothetical protein